MFVPCLFKKSTKKAKIKRQAFVMEIARVHSSLERSEKKLKRIRRNSITSFEEKDTD